MGFLKNAVKKALLEVNQDNSESDILKIRKLNEELENLKLKRKLEDTEIKALMQMERDKNKLELESKRIALEGEFQKKEMVLMKDYHEKTLGLLNKNEEVMNKTYNEIMKRLPTINVDLGNQAKGK